MELEKKLKVGLSEKLRKNYFLLWGKAIRCNCVWHPEVSSRK